MKRSSAPLALAILASGHFSARAAVIDLFLEGSQELHHPGSEGSWTTGTEVPLAESLFSSRTMRAQYGLQNLAVDTTLGRFFYEVVPDGPSLNDRGYFQLIYRSATPLDLLADGATGFEARFAMLDFGSSFGPLELEVFSGTGDYRVSEYIDSSDATSIRFDFSRFREVDFSSVTEIRFGGLRIPEGSSLVLNSLQTVPEPSAPLFTTLGVMALLRRRRNRR